MGRAHLLGFKLAFAHALLEHRVVVRAVFSVRELLGGNLRHVLRPSLGERRVHLRLISILVLVRRLLVLLLLAVVTQLLLVDRFLRSHQLANLLLFSAVVVEETLVSLPKSLLILSAVPLLVLSAIAAFVLVFLLLLDLVDLVDPRVHKVVVDVLNPDSALRAIDRPVGAPGVAVTTLPDLIVTLGPVFVESPLLVGIVVLSPHPDLVYNRLVRQLQALDPMFKVGLLVLLLSRLLGSAVALVDALQDVKGLVGSGVLALQLPQFGEL